MIELRNLVKRYGDHLAVDHLNLTIEDGKIYGFLGPNGAGKSTTMNMITGYLSATEGEVLINGHNILTEAEEAKRCIGYLPEVPPLYQDMTVTEYLSFCAELKKVPKAERSGQIAQVLEMTRLEDVSGRLIKNLSKGYKQRVGLAQAILGFPPILILDEPTVGLDPKQITEIRDLIRTLSEKHTVILSSHILSEVQAICDQIIIISHGRLMANDSAETLEEHLRSGARLKLQAVAEPETVMEILSGVAGILKTDISGCTGGVTTAMLELESGSDPRVELFFAFAKRETALIELSMQSASLEQVFLELTEDSTTEGTADAESPEPVSETAEKEEIEE